MFQKPVSSLAEWLCPTDFDRRRALDTSERVRRARVAAGVLIGAAAILMIPEFGWIPVAIFAVQFGYLAGLDQRMERAEFPEVQAAAGMFSTGISMTAAIVVTGGPDSPLLPLLAVPVSIIAARFRPEVVFAGVVIAVSALAVVALAMDPGGVIEDPSAVIVAMIVVAGTALIAVAIQGAEVQHRRESVIDPLTGLLNRKALESRFYEIEEQAHLTGAPVSMIEFDLDHFKRVNDSRGHETGDALLRDLAYEVRKSLRSFELVYRIGGEEFLVVLPGVPLTEAIEIAERIRSLVLHSRPAGVEITTSLGVAAASGDRVTFDSLYGRVDAALYEAKREGRNRVIAAGYSVPAPQPPVPVAAA